MRAPQPGAPFAYVTTAKPGGVRLRRSCYPDLGRLKAEGVLQMGQGEAELDGARAELSITTITRSRRESWTCGKGIDPGDPDICRFSIVGY